MATEHARPQPSQPSRPSEAASGRNRSPIERAIVWGVILVLLVVGLIEAHARLGYSNTITRLEDGQLGPLSSMRENVQFWPIESRENVRIEGADWPVVTLKWFSFLHDYRIALHVDSVEAEDPVVLKISTAGEDDGILARAAREPAEARPGGPDPNAGVPTPGGGGDDGGPPGGGPPGGGGFGPPGGGPPGGGQGGGRRPPDFDDLDQNSDGKLTPDELSGNLREAFPLIDKNEDGGIDQEELDAWRAQRRAARSEGERADGQPAPAADPPADAPQPDQDGAAETQPPEEKADEPLEPGETAAPDEAADKPDAAAAQDE
ncbi:MAG TPA: hypothetical protein VML55_05140 [Planctomycetaceae bacterium]|nr:hypothetical protein [Planctomycetaceae bacterium]